MRLVNLLKPLDKFFVPSVTANKVSETLINRSKQSGLNELLAYMLMPDEQTVVNKDGSFMATFLYRGPDVESSTGSELDQIVASMNQALRMMDSSWMMETNLIRVSATGYPKVEYFPDPVSLMIEHERNAQYNSEEAHFDTFTYITFTHLPDKPVRKEIKDFFFESPEKNRDLEPRDLHKRFEEGLSGIIDVLTTHLRMQRIRGVELTTFLYFTITGKQQKIHVPQQTMFLDCSLADQPFVGGINPKIGQNYIRTLSLSEFPRELYPTIMEILNSMPLIFRWSLRFIPLGHKEAAEKLKDYGRSWYSKAMGLKGALRQSFGGAEHIDNKDAQEKVDEVDDAKKANENGDIRYGFLTGTIVLMHDNLEKLEHQVREFEKLLRQMGFSIINEDYNAIEAYLGSIPCHGDRNVRKYFMNSYEFSCMAPLSSIYQGEAVCPCPFYPANSPPLFYSATQGATPFRFNLHVSDVGHTMIIGPTGGGKSTLLGLIVAQHRKYQNSHVYIFDKDNSNKVTTLSLGGDYYDVGKNNAIALAPLSHLDDPEEFDWTIDFLEGLITLQKVDLTPQRKGEIRSALDTLKGGSKDTWNLSGFIDMIQNRELRQALEVYSESEVMSSLLNAHEDNINLGSFMSFEMGWLLEQSSAYYLPVIDYLFRVLYRKFKERHPALLIFEEAWLYLDNAYFAKKIKDWFKTLRKFNVSIIILSQSLKDISGKTELSMVLMESCKTKIYLPTEKMTDEAKEVYRSCGLNDQQINILGSAKPKRHYYVTYPQGNRLIDLGLSPGLSH